MGEWEFNWHQLEKASRANGAVPLARRLVAALVLGAADRFREPRLLWPVLEHQIWLPWHVARGVASRRTGFIALKGDGLARADALSSTQPFSVSSPFCQLLGPSQNLSVITQR